MKKIILFTTLICFGLSVLAERNITTLSKCKWYVGKEKPTSITDFKNQIPGLIAIENSTLMRLNEGNMVIRTTIDITDEKAKKLLVSIENGAHYFNVYIEDQKLENFLQNEDFLSETDIPENDGEILLTLILMPREKIIEENLSSILQNSTLTTLSGIAISWLAPQKDLFFGSYLLKIHILNSLEKDVDGKLIAKIFNQEYSELIAENNNCAFTRSGTESSIEITFPDTQLTLIKGNYIAEIELLDKENNEEVIDRIKIPFRLE